MTFTTTIVTAAFAFFVASPLRSASATTTYTCKVDAGYHVEDDNNNPTYPTSTEKDWAVSTLRTSYRAVHNSASSGDFDMDSANWDVFTLTEDRRADADADAVSTTKKNLRAGVQGWTQYYALLKSDVSIGCNLCGSWDDDDAAAEMVITKNEKEWLYSFVGTSATHTRWIAAFCDELQQGPYAVFEYAENCQIALYDCTSDTWNNEIEEILAHHQVKTMNKNRKEN